MKQLLRVTIIFLAAFFALFLVARLHGYELSQSQTNAVANVSAENPSARIDA